MSEALRQLNSPSSVITLRGTEKLKGSPALRVMSLRIPGLGGGMATGKKPRLYENHIFIRGIFLHKIMTLCPGLFP